MKYALPVYYDGLEWWQRREVRAQYVDQQGGRCHFCGHDISSDPPKEVTELQVDWSMFPDNFRKYPVHLQHDHTTGLTEGAVHAICNAVLWQYHGK